MSRRVFVALVILVMAGFACDASTGSVDRPKSMGDFAPSSDTTLEGGQLRFRAFTIPAGVTVQVASDTVILVDGESQIDGILSADGGPLIIKAQGDLTVNGTLSAIQDLDAMEEGEEPSGIRIVAQAGLEFGPDSVLQTNGHIYVVDDENALALTPQQIAAETDSASGDLPTLVPLPPDHPAFQSSSLPWRPNTRSAGLLRPYSQGATIRIRGTVDVSHFPGDQQILLYRFFGNYDLTVEDFTVIGPQAPPGKEDVPDSGDARGGDGKKGMRLNIHNEGGSINFNNVTLYLTDGGDGGPGTATCGVAEGGAGGDAGNFRATAGLGINIQSLTIMPGRGGHGGDATATCDTPGGDAIKAVGGPGADNNKRLYARGNVNGIENVIIGPVVAGNGGSAVAEAANGEDGEECEDGQDGGEATAIGGDGGDASLSVSGLPVTVGEVRGGDGGDAEAWGGDGGDGGPCPCGATEGGKGGEANVTPGSGGNAQGGNPSIPGTDGNDFSFPGIDGEGAVDICSQALDLYDQGDLEGALAMLDDVIEANPDMAIAYVIRGVMLVALGDYEGAIADFQHALDLDPLDPRIHYNMGIGYFNMGHNQDALAAFQQTIELDPTFVMAYYGIGITEDLLGNTAAAIAAYGQFLELYDHEDEFSEYANQRLEELSGEPVGDHPDEPGGVEVEGTHICHTSPPCETQITVHGEPGASVEATLTGPGGDLETQTGTIGSDGSLTLTWDVYTHDTYVASGWVGEVAFEIEVPAP